MAGHSQELYDVLSPACEKLANGDPWDTTAMVEKKTNSESRSRSQSRSLIRTSQRIGRMTVAWNL